MGEDAFTGGTGFTLEKGGSLIFRVTTHRPQFQRENAGGMRTLQFTLA